MVAISEKSGPDKKKKEKSLKNSQKKKKKTKKVSFEKSAKKIDITEIDSLISDIRAEVDQEIKEEENNEEIEMQSDEEVMEDDDVQEEILDEKSHTKLLKNFGVEERKKIKERVLPVDPADKELEGKVTVNDLLQSVKKQRGIKSVEKLLDIAKDKDIKTLDEPLPRFQQEQAEREVNYDKTKKEVSKWLPIVKRNRETENMTFPLYHAQTTKEKEDITSFANKRAVPCTPLEEEIFQVLGDESHMLERPDHFLTEAEEKSLQELTAEEAELRREELAKMRALLSYQEEKFRRKKKIKSKKYHKILKKEKQKQDEKVLSAALKENPAVAAADEAEKADYLRALERISQKHKVGGKWNKNLLHKNIKDPELKKALSEQRQIRHKLMEKQTISSDEEDEVGATEQEPESGVSDTPPEEFEVDPNNPWLMLGGALTGQSELPNVTTPSVDQDTTVTQDTAVAQDPDPVLDSTEKTIADDQEDVSSSSDDEEVSSEDIEEKGKEGRTKENEVTSVTLDQDALIDMAFANDDVVAQFAEEKEKIVDEETEKDVDVTLPGWGTWAGIGTNDKPKKKIIRKAKPQAPRKDAKLSHVIINTKKNRKLEQHLVSKLPHPYKSRSVFERELRQPIGPQWNSVRSFRNMIKPSVTVLDGHVIQPMTAPKGFENVRIKGKRKCLGS